MDLNPEFTAEEKVRGEKMFDLLEKMNEASLRGNLGGLDAAVVVLGRAALESLLLIAVSCLDPAQLQECRRLVLDPPIGDAN